MTLEEVGVILAGSGVSLIVNSSNKEMLDQNHRQHTFEIRQKSQSIFYSDYPADIEKWLVATSHQRENMRRLQGLDRELGKCQSDLLNLQAEKEQMLRLKQDLTEELEMVK